MLRALLLGLALAVPLSSAAVPAVGVAQSAGHAYVGGIPDLPLMPGLQELPDSGLVFDKPGGRIVEAFAQGSMTPEAVAAFYEETLPQLGWRHEGRGAYLREGERLELGVGREAGRTTVHFRLFPQ